MGKTILCGDTHGTFDIGKLQRYFAFCEYEFSKDEDYLIICGDVEACGFDPSDERATRELLQSLPVTILFVDGNHENHPALNSYPVEEWHGGKVHFIAPDIIHLMRGQIFEINGKTFFTFGGAFSVDRDSRIEGVSWFEEEIPTQEEYAEGWKNLKRVGGQVDYIITHTAPFEIVAEMGFGSYDEALEQTREFQRIADAILFSDWYFGHFHQDEDILNEDIDNFHCLWERVVEI